MEHFAKPYDVSKANRLIVEPIKRQKRAISVLMAVK